MALSARATERRLKFALFQQAAGITKDHPDFQRSQNLHAALSRSPAYKKHLKDSKARAAALAAAYHLNGPDLPTDIYLRRFLREYNNRLFHGFGNEQPTSFSVIRSFVEPDDRALVLILLDELFYQCDVTAFIDFITSNKVTLEPVSPSSFQDSTIYNLNCIGPFSQIILPDFGEFVFCGGAMVREESELAILGIFGHKSENYKLRFLDTDNSDILPSKRELFRRTGVETVYYAAENLLGNADYYPLLALTRIDLNTMSIQVQHIMLEAKGAFSVTTDDPSIYYDSSGKPLNDPRIEGIKATAAHELPKYRHIFDFMHHFVYFPQFIRAKEDEFYVERHPTQFRLQSDPRVKNIKATIQRVKATLDRTYWPLYRDVLTLRPPAVERVNSRSLRPLAMRREISGFWKILPLDKAGSDRHGNRIQGKTWVTKELSWTEDISQPSEATSSISIISEPLGDSFGYVYIMRSPMHGPHIYKIGFTNRSPEERANDLSASSGQPDNLIVIQSWKVIDARRVEQVIHRQLEQFRISGRREFFNVKFEVARKTVEDIINTLNATAPEEGFLQDEVTHREN